MRAMRRGEILSMLASVGIPCAYHHFPAHDRRHPAPEPPFICFLFPESRNFHADNQSFQHIARLRIELYLNAHNRTFTHESALETVLNTHGFGWRKEETLIETEAMYLISYETEVALNAESDE